MYVEAVAERSGSAQAAKVAKKGIIKSPEVIEKLKAVGVISVIVDTAKTITETSPTSEVAAPANSNKARSFSDKLASAHALYQQAKQLQAQALDNISEGRAFDMSAFVELSDGFVESLFDDQDALLCASMMKNKDDYLLEHSINVALLLGAFARYLERPMEEIKALILGGFLHDVGKVKVADGILKKPGKLTPEEYQEMKRHVEYGIAAVANQAQLPQIAKQVIAEHHERLNGKGYPAGLSGDEISLYGRMAAIADCYDAIISVRCYKDGEVAGRAFKILLNDSGSHFDTELVGKFIKCIGVYPVGTLVELKSGRLGMVIRKNLQNPLRPLIKVFYNWRQKHFIESREVDLGRTFEEDEIERTVRAESLSIDIPRYFEEFMLTG